MKCDLVLKGQLSKIFINKNFVYDNELDDFSSISSDISNIFSDENIEFSLKLNGVILPVEMWSDFPYFLDDFSDYIDFLFLEDINSFAYYLSNQGIETNIGFHQNEDKVNITEKIFLKSSYSISLKELQKDIILFFDKLMELIENLIPNMKNNIWFRDWEEKIKYTILDSPPLPHSMDKNK